jgi:polyisoprenoid-binding protein YceI
MLCRQYLQIAAISCGLLTVSAAAYAALSSASDAKVTFGAAGPAGFKIEGTTSDLTVAEGNGNVVVSVPLGNLTTGIALRDHHMKEKYLEVGRYPAAVLTVARASLKFPGGGEQQEGDAPAMLSLHGQTRPVTVHYSAKGDGAGMATQGRFHINMNEYGITVPSYLGVTVKPDVDVTAAFRVAGN